MLIVYILSFINKIWITALFPGHKELSLLRLPGIDKMFFFISDSHFYPPTMHPELSEVGKIYLDLVEQKNLKNVSVYLTISL